MYWPPQQIDASWKALRSLLASLVREVPDMVFALLGYHRAFALCTKAPTGCTADHFPYVPGGPIFIQGCK
jgi:hypothetical protein